MVPSQGAPLVGQRELAGMIQSATSITAPLFRQGCTGQRPAPLNLSVQEAGSLQLFIAGAEKMLFFQGWGDETEQETP